MSPGVLEALFCLRIFHKVGNPKFNGSSFSPNSPLIQWLSFSPIHPTPGKMKLKTPAHGPAKAPLAILASFELLSKQKCPGNPGRSPWFSRLTGP
jgi:hypothetical protein